MAEQRVTGEKPIAGASIEPPRQTRIKYGGLERRGKQNALPPGDRLQRLLGGHPGHESGEHAPLGLPSLGIKSKSARQIARPEPTGRLGGSAILFSLNRGRAEKMSQGPGPVPQDKRTAHFGGVSAHAESLLAIGVENPAFRERRQRLTRPISRSGRDPPDPNIKAVPQKIAPPELGAASLDLRYPQALRKPRGGQLALRSTAGGKRGYPLQRHRTRILQTGIANVFFIHAGQTGDGPDGLQRREPAFFQPQIKMIAQALGGLEGNFLDAEIIVFRAKAAPRSRHRLRQVRFVSRRFCHSRSSRRVAPTAGATPMAAVADNPTALPAKGICRCPVLQTKRHSPS